MHLVSGRVPRARSDAGGAQLRVEQRGRALRGAAGWRSRAQGRIYEAPLRRSAPFVLLG